MARTTHPFGADANLHVGLLTFGDEERGGYTKFSASHTNVSKDRFRRALVCHYANARSFTMWGSPDRQAPSNHLHILARGWTHLPFGLPRFGTPCAANTARPQPAAPDAAEMPMAMMGDIDKGDMVAAPQDPQRNDPTMMRSHEADAIHV